MTILEFGLESDLRLDSELDLGTVGNRARICDFYPVKGQFRSGETVALVVELANGGGAELCAALVLTITELDGIVRTLAPEPVVVPPGGTATVIVEAGAFDTAFTGYGAEAALYAADRAMASADGAEATTDRGPALSDGAEAQAAEGMASTEGEEAPAPVAARQPLDAAATAFDVVADWRVAPRYGFLSDFGGGEAGDGEDVKWLAKLHINLVHFYDWMYRHDDLVGEAGSYVDMMGREVSRAVVEEKIRLCGAYGMKAIAYGAVYAAGKAFAERHPDWRLYTSAGEPYDFIGIFSIMNIAPDSPWSRHIVNEYRKAVEVLGFDGIHLDTYGFPKTGWSRMGEEGASRLERLEVQFPALIEATRTALSRVKDDIALIFNNVGNWPVDTVARASQDAIYVEVWKPYERYHHLGDIVRWAKHLSGGKPVILAAYLKPFREPGPLGIAGAERAFRLLSAVVAAHGATNLLHGEAGGLLTQAYYVDYSPLRPAFRRIVRDYADFGVRYGHLLYGEGYRDVSMTHADGDNLEYVFEGFACSAYGEAGKVWTIIRESGEAKLIHFVNLTSAADDYWNESKEAAAPVEGRRIAIALDGEIEALLLASPDREGGRPFAPAFRIAPGPRGRTAFVELPPLLYWDVLIVRLKYASQ